MENNNYMAVIEVEKSPKHVFNCVNEVSKWWSKEFEGNSLKLNDEFVIRFRDVHYSRHKIIESVPGKKVVWLVTDSKLNWIEKDKHEWTNTKMIFEIIPKGDKTALTFTHEGLAPQQECYEKCKEGWNMIIHNWLLKFLTEGKSI